LTTDFTNYKANKQAVQFISIQLLLFALFASEFLLAKAATALARLSIRLSVRHTGESVKLGSPNLHRRLQGRL